MNEGTVYERMARVVAALNHIPKERSQGVTYLFRGIDAVMNALHKPLADNGLFLSPRVLDDWHVSAIPGSADKQGNPRSQWQATFRVCVDVYAADGSMVTLGPGLAQSHDYGDKAVYQAQQNAIKYVLLEAFAIPTDEQEMDARVSDPSPVVEPDPVELSRLATNKLKAEALEKAGDPGKAKELWESATLAVGLDPEVTVPLDRVQEVRNEIGAAV